VSLKFNTKSGAIAVKAKHTAYDIGYSCLLNLQFHSFTVVVAFDHFQPLFRCMTSARAIPEVEIVI